MPNRNISVVRRRSPPLIYTKEEKAKYIDHQHNITNLYASNSKSQPLAGGTKGDYCQDGIWTRTDRPIVSSVTQKLTQLGEEEKEKIRKEKMVLGVAADMRRNLGTIKEKVLEKVVAASVPADGLENARHFIESVIRDVSVTAHGLTKDALLRIKTHLVELLPSLSPNVKGKMVDDAEKEANNGQSRQGRDDVIEENHRPKEDEGGSNSKAAPYLSPTSSLFTSLVKPLSARL